MKTALFGWVLLTGCVQPRAPRLPPPHAWVLGQLSAPDGSPVLAMCRVEAPPGTPRNLVALVDVPGDTSVGEEFRIAVRIPAATPDAVHRVRIIPNRPGVRLPRGDVIEVQGRGPAPCNAVADSAGDVAFTAVLEP